MSRVIHNLKSCCKIKLSLAWTPITGFSNLGVIVAQVELGCRERRGKNKHYGQLLQALFLWIGKLKTGQELREIRGQDKAFLQWRYYDIFSLSNHPSEIGKKNEAWVETVIIGAKSLKRRGEWDPVLSRRFVLEQTEGKVHETEAYAWHIW